MGFCWAQEQNTREVTIEGDCACVINKISSSKEDITTSGLVLKVLKDFFKHSSMVNFKWCGRCSNKAADCLSNLVLKNHYNSIFYMDFPNEIHNFLISDSFE